MNFKRLIVTCLSGCALIISFSFGIVYAKQPHMQAALDYLQMAKSELQQADTNKDGHRLEAIGFVNQAIREVHAGINAANHR